MSTDRDIRTKPKIPSGNISRYKTSFSREFWAHFFSLSNSVSRQTSTFQWPRAKTSGSLRLECAVRTQLPDSLLSFISRVSQSAQIHTVPRAHKPDGTNQHSAPRALSLNPSTPWRRRPGDPFCHICDCWRWHNVEKKVQKCQINSSQLQTIWFLLRLV